MLLKRLVLRTRAEITMHVLESALQGSTKTMIMYKVFLSDRQANEYLADLVQRQLINQDKNKHSFFTTEKGRRFLKTHDNLREFVASQNVRESSINKSAIKQ